MPPAAKPKAPARSRGRKRADVRFAASGQQCAGWFFLPTATAAKKTKTDAGLPCVVLAHGFGALKEARLDAFAERFAAAGFAALAFDYRHFGESDGEPRQLLDIGRQLADWASAVSYVRGREEVDAARVALWGTSFSGGHVFEVAARDPRVAAVISQVPHASGPASAAGAGPRNAARETADAVRDVIGARAGRDPVYLPIVGAPGSYAAMTSPDAQPGYSRLYPEGFEWRNEVAARIFLSLARYSPGRAARRISCPVLVQVAEDDAVTPPGPARRAAGNARRGELRTYPLGHFDPYVGEAFEQFSGDQVDFLQRHLAS
ncbi:MAG: alpha/beta hydrolase [Solirubrobacteraceae bacterium]